MQFSRYKGKINLEEKEGKEGKEEKTSFHHP